MEEIRPPFFKSFDARSWIRFAEDFQEYRARGGNQTLERCFSYATRDLVRQQFQVPSLNAPPPPEESEDEKKMTKAAREDLRRTREFDARAQFEDRVIQRVTAAFAPRSTFVSVSRFNRLRMSAPTIADFRRYTQRFQETLHECSSTLPPDQALIKSFIDGLLPLLVADHVRSSRPATMADAMRLSLEAFQEHETAMVFVDSASSRDRSDRRPDRQHYDPRPRWNTPRDYKNHRGARDGYDDPTQRRDPRSNRDDRRQRDYRFSNDDRSTHDPRTPREQRPPRDDRRPRDERKDHSSRQDRPTSDDRRRHDRDDRRPKTDHRPRDRRPQDDSRTIVCFNCNRKGHYASECRDRDPHSAAVHADPRPAPDRSVEWPVQPYSDEESTRYDSAAVSEPSPTKPPTVTADVFETKATVECLLDTGSSVSIVAPRTVRKVWSKLLSRPSTIPFIRLASGEQIDIKTEIQLNLTFPTAKTLRGWFIVAPCIADILLGRPHLSSIGVQLDSSSVVRSTLTNKVDCTSSEFVATNIGEKTSKSPDADTFQWEHDTSPDPLDELSPFNTDSSQSVPSIDLKCPFSQGIRTILEDFKDLFSDSSLETPSSLPPMPIKLKDKVDSVSRPPMRISKRDSEFLEQEVSKLLSQGIIRPSSSPWASPAFVVRSGQRDPRLVIDYTALNDRIDNVSFPMRKTEDILERFRDYRFFGKLDLRSAYHQIALQPEACYLTAFATPRGLYEFTRVPYGIKTAPQYFTMALSTALRPVPDQDSYIDDIVFGGATPEEYLRTLRDLFSVLRKHSLKLKPSKCILGATELNFLGHVVDKDTIRPCPTRKAGIATLVLPKSKAQLHSFLGLANYLRKFVPNYAALAKPLFALITPSARFAWTPPTEQAFHLLKQKLTEAAPLYHLDPSCPLVLRTDASLVGVGAVLLQLKDGIEQPISYTSHAFSDRERRWSTIEQEAYGIYFAVRSFSVYLHGHHFTVETDHANLVYLRKAQASKLIRWRLLLQEFSFQIKHIPGRTNTVADALSRCCATTTEQDTLSLFHGPVTGHCGVEELIRRVKAADQAWPTLAQDAATFVKHCVVCQKVRSGHLSLPAGQSAIKPTAPFSELSIDTLGPLPADSSGFKYILVIQDSFSKYIELIPTKDATAQTAALGLIQVFARYGAPRSIRSDQGLQFTAKIISELLKAFAVQPTLVAAYHPIANGIVERSHRETVRHLRALISAVKSKDNWSVFMPFIQRIQNDTFCRAIGTSPSQLLFAGAVRPLQFLAPAQPAQTTSVSDYVLSLQQAYDKILAASVAHFADYVQANEKKHPAHIRRFQPGHLVLMQNAPTAEDKLDLPWIGPFVIVEEVSAGIYLIQDLRTRQTKQAAAVRLKRAFIVDQDPVAVAAEDKREFPVEAILDHEVKGNGKQLSQWSFLVRWRHCEPHDDMWLPYREVKDLEALDNYLDSNPSVRLPLKRG